jgi:hypothetical protein
VRTPNDWTREYHDFLAVFDEVNAELSRIPGVIRVSVGVKEEDGGLTQRMAFRVYVRAKLPEDAIPPEQVVPRTVRGFPTDVVVEGRKVEITGFNDENDYRNYQTKVGGIRIGNDKQLHSGTPFSLSRRSRKRTPGSPIAWSTSSRAQRRARARRSC